MRRTPPKGPRVNTSRFRRALTAIVTAGALTAGIAATASAAGGTLPTLYFASCAEAKAAGYRNILVGMPGYRLALDADRDGVACEDANYPTPSVPTPKPTPTPTPVPVVPQTTGRMFGVDGAGNLQYFTGNLASGMKLVGHRGTGWGGMTYLAQVNHLAGDSARDLLARKGADNSLWLYSASTSGNVAAVRQMGSNWGGMDQIVPVFNLGGGSTQYVVARRKADGSLFRYRLTATGLSGGTKIGSSWNGMRQIIGVGDFDRDGRADVLAIRNDGTLWAYKGTSAATIGSGRQVGHGWASFRAAFSPGDLNGDTRFELAGWRDDNVYGYGNRGGSWESAKVILTGVSSYKLLA